MYFRRFIGRANHILTISEYVKQSIIETCGTPSDKITIAYNGCRNLFAPLTLAEKNEVKQAFSDGKPYFFYTGAIHPRKNIPRLIRAYTQFRSRTGADVQLLLGGRFMGVQNEVAEAIEASCFKHDIKILGYVPEPDLAKLMGAALALTYPSLSEGFGLPVLEAMQADVPVLTSNTTALPEVAGAAAILVNPLDENAITTGLIQLLDATLGHDLIEKGRIQRQKFNWDTASEILHDRLVFTAQQ